MTTDETLSPQEAPDTPVKIRYLISWAVAVVLAVFVGISSFVIANQSRNPAAASAWGVPPSAAATANVVFASFAARQSKDPGAKVTASERAVAAGAYQREPLSSAALGILIVSTTGEGQMQTRQGLLDLGGKLTRRSSLLSSEQIRSAALRGDDQTFFLWLSRSILTNDQLRSTYITAMAQATAKAGAVEALAPVIGQSPSWATYYWQKVGETKASLGNAARLRIAVAGAPWRQTAVTKTDENLLLALTRDRQFDAARELAAVLEKTMPRREGMSGLLVNTDFSRQPQLPPFDWLLARSGALGSSIDEKKKSLLISAIGGARGNAASQLVRLQPGRYILNWSSTTNAPVDPATLSARIYCAERGKTANPTLVPIAAGKGSAPIVIGEGTCRWYWVSLHAALADESPGMDVYFHAVSLTRAPAAGGA